MNKENRDESHREWHDQRLAQQRYKQQVNEIKHRAHEEQHRIREEMLRDMHKLHSGSQRFGRQKRDVDFEHYYTRLKYARPMGIIFLVVLWALLFALGGFSTGVGVVFSIFAALSTIGYVVQIVSFTGMEKRVLKPIQNLKQGMDEIARGHYDIEIDAQGALEVRSLIENFNEMAKKLKEHERLQAEYESNRKQLIANISHDLKTPITSVLGYIEAVADAQDMPIEKLTKYLKIIHNNVAYLNKLIDDLFLFSKLDMQKLELSFADTAVSPFLADIMEEFSLELQEKGAALEYTDDTQASLRALIDHKRFHQVLRNIIDNACKYGASDTLKLKIRLRQNGGEILIDIWNNGPAIPKESLTHLFDRFYRIDTARTKDISSTGLGLAIAKELILAHCGTIAVASDELAGTTFTISLPSANCAEKGSRDEEHTDH